MAKPKILISALTDEDTKTHAFCESFLAVLFNRSEMVPEFVANFDPISNAINTAADALPYWNRGTFYWLRRHPIVSQGGVSHTYPNKPGTITLDASFDNSSDWLSLFRDLVCVTNSYYAYLHLVTQEEWDQTELSPEDASVFRSGAFAKTLKNGLLDLGWANYFGPRWRDQINPIKLASTCSHVEHLNGGYLFSITEDIADVKTDYFAFDKRRQAVKAGFDTGVFRGSARPPS